MILCSTIELQAHLLRCVGLIRIELITEVSLIYDTQQGGFQLGPPASGLQAAGVCSLLLPKHERGIRTRGATPCVEPRTNLEVTPAYGTRTGGSAVLERRAEATMLRLPTVPAGGCRKLVSRLPIYNNARNNMII